MENGLPNSEALKRLQQFGNNVIITTPSSSTLSILLSQFPTLLNGILAAAAVFSFIIGNTIDGIFILLILLLNGFLGFIQEYKAEQSLEKLKHYTIPSVRVIRDGKERAIPSTELVPGDLVILNEGERIPADGILTTSHHIELDEAILTGESLPIIKNDKDPVFLGTLVTKGKARMQVEKTGMSTKFGQIAQTLGDIKSDTTPLQKNLSGLGKILSGFIIIISLLIIPIGLLQGNTAIPLLLLAISIAVAAIPEGLPAVITIALAIGASRIAKQKAIVRKMPAIETLGAVQVILMDKTGTLTQNSMQVKKYEEFQKGVLPDIIRASVLGNTASLIQKADSKEFDIVGDQTDGALLQWALSENKDIQVELSQGQVEDEYVFDPETRMITTVWKKNDKRFVFTRGAPEKVAEKSKLSKEEKEKIISLYKEYAKEGLRVICFAKKQVSSHDKAGRESLESDLTFLGIMGIYDPPRPEVHNSIQQAKRAGIQLVMVTGDNELTALSIGKETGLLEQDEDVVTGEELKKLSDDQVSALLPKTRIFARATPHDKLRLATLFQKKGYVVGVTGDGVNDALALKKADVGIAMGESGTDVAKEASDIILTDDNFATLVKAIEEGRTIYNNILKSTTYLLTGNLAELLVVFIATLLGLPPPFHPTQILWINLVTDGLPALALASDSKNPLVLNQTPRNSKAPLLSSSRLTFIVGVGLALGISLIICYSIFLQIFSELSARAIIFNFLILFHLILVYVVRRQSIISASPTVVISILITLVLQILAMTLHPFRILFHLR